MSAAGDSQDHGDGPMVGGWTDATNSNSSEKENAVQFAIGKLKEKNEVEGSDKVSVVSVKQQGER
jgi:tRNA-binding EMAP/Myf-like protein